MTSKPAIDMREVTRLTREGRLEEAMALLRTAPLPSVEAFQGAQTPSPFLDQRETPFSQAARAWMGRLSSAIAEPAPLPAVASRSTGGRFEARSFSGPAGTRDYKLYVPSGFQGAALPLIVMLHGCTQSPDDFAAGTRMNEVADELGLLVAYPAQSKSANASKCWNWFNGADQQRGRGEPSLIAGIVQEIMADHPVRRHQIYVAGLSAGGAAAAVMGATYPDLFAAIGVHSGLACGAARDMASAFEVMRGGGAGIATTSTGDIVPTIVFHGDRDSTVHPLNADQVIAQARADRRLDSSVTTGTTPAGMRFTKSVAADAAGRPVLEQWTLHDAGHAWSGGSPAGSFTDPNGPDASREMVRFFLESAQPK